MKLIYSLLSLLISVTVFSQSPKQKIIDRTFVPFYLGKSIELGGKIYSVGSHEASQEYYPGLVIQNYELTPEWVGLPYRGSFSVDKLQTIGGLIASPDNALIMAGTNGVLTNADVWMFKMDTVGNVIWQTDVQTAANQSTSNILANTNNGGLVIATEYPTSAPSNIQLINIDGNGDSLWTRKVSSDLGSSLKLPRGYSKSNGEFVVVFRSGFDSQFLAIDASGNQQGISQYEDAFGSTIRAQATYYDGVNTYVAGRINGGDYTSIIMKLDNNGNVLWCKNYPEISVLSTIHVTSNGDIIANGISTGGQFINQVQMIKVDANGAPIIAKTYGQLPASHKLYSQLVEVNGHYLLSGKRQYQTVSTAYQILLDDNLNSGSCYERVFEISENTFSISQVTGISVSLNSLQPEITFYGTNATPTTIWGASYVHYDINNIITTEIELIGDDCGGVCNGEATATASGGNPTHTFEWSNGQTGTTATGLCADDEVVLLTGDQLGCYVYDTIIVPQQAPITDVCVVTVDATSSKNEVVWEKPISNTIEGFTIYRDIAGNYGLVGYVPYDSLSKFVDNTNGVDPNITSYRYKIATLDTCGNESELSDYHETIHLTVNQGSGSVVNLIWDNYEGFAFSYNRILMDSLGNGNWQVKDSVSSNVFTWTNNNSPSDSTGYMIEVITPNTCTATKAQDHNTTRSNRHTALAPVGATSIEETILSNVNLFPNPNQGIFTVNIQSDNWSYSLFDMSGKLIVNEMVFETNKEIDIQELETGIYLMRINLGESSVYKKIIKQ